MPEKKGQRRKGGVQKKVAPRATAQQLEATVHTSLPPLVQGGLRAYLKVCVSAIVWEYNIGPPASKLCVGLKWWGEQSSGTVFRVPVISSQQKTVGESTSLAYYPIRSGLPQLKAYLKDMKALQLLVGLGHMTDDSMVIGRCTVPALNRLSEKKPLEGSFPIVSLQGHTLGRLELLMEIQVAPAARAHLMAPALDDSQVGFTVGPGATVKAKRKQLQEVGRGEDTQGRASRVKFSSPPAATAQLHSEVSTQAVADHKVALVAKYTQYRSEDTLEGEVDKASLDRGGRGPSARVHGPRQQEIISELIERGEKLQDAMVMAMLKSHQEDSSVMGRSGEAEEGNEGRGRPFLETLAWGGQERRKLGHSVHKKEKPGAAVEEGVLDLLLEKGTGRGRGGLDGAYGSSSSEGDEGQQEISMDESDYPLKDPSLLEKLLYGAFDEKKETPPSEERQTLVNDGTGSRTEFDSKARNTHSPTHPTDLPPSSSEPHTQGIPTTTHPTLPQSPPTSPAHTSSPPSHPPDENGSCSQADTGSLTTLASFFSGQSSHKTMDSEILEGLGMERLTWLGRVTSARVVVESLRVDLDQLETLLLLQKKRKMTQSAPDMPSSGTYFVEYHFPAQLATGKMTRVGKGRRRVIPPPHEVVRVASKKMKDGVVKFRQRSMFPVTLTGQMTRQWWHDLLVFRVYYRPPTDRMPFLLGKARLPLRQWLMASSSSSQFEVEVQGSVLTSGARTDASSERTLGKLTVSVQLLCGQGHELSEEGGSSSEVVRAVSPPRESGYNREEDGKWSQAPLPVRVKEKTLTADVVHKQPTALQLLIMVPEGRDLYTMSGRPTKPASESPAPPAPEIFPNCYLVCRLFCAQPHPKTPTMWATPHPQFNFRQVHPLYLTPSLLDQVCNNFTVVEVWHKTPGTTSDDELLGLVKLSLHQFYLAFSEESSSTLCLNAELPVIAVDSYCPVMNPFTGTQHGYLAVLLAMGSTQQISVLQQKVASGTYILQQPHSKDTHRPEPPRSERVLHQDLIEEDQRYETSPVHHTFDVTVNGVRGLSVFSNTVWGEADCFVQYHFPSATEHSPEEEQSCEITLRPCRTDMTLCVPNPSFSHEARHTLTLPQGHPVQREVMRACGSSGVPFELWRRFYYPNIRDQLIAKASLPLAKLCALVTMQRMAGPNVQSFSLPMKLVAQESGSGGILEITVQYQALLDGVQLDLKESDKKTHVNVSVGILRATGLKDAAVLAAREHPVPLGFAAEVGTNCYARISIPDFLDKEKRTTKTIARSFAPEFSHFFDFALPLVSRETIHPYSMSIPLAQRLTECSIVVEIWHQVPKKDTRPAPVDGKVFGRRLTPAFKDVCLGHVEIPLIQLLQKQTGVHGWFPLVPSIKQSDTTSASTADPDPESACSYVGGMEVSLSFSNKDDRKLVISRGTEMGWVGPEGSGIHLDSPDGVEQPPPHQVPGDKDGCLQGPTRWRFDIRISQLWTPLESVVIFMSGDHRLCYLRYKFFEAAPVVTVPKALSDSHDDRACYHLNHQARVSLVNSPQLCWYLNEDALEIEVWSSVTKRQLNEERPSGEDSLLGTASVSLRALSHPGKNAINSYCPVFKSGVESLGNQLLLVEIEKSEAESVELKSEAESLNIAMEILNSPEQECFIPLKPISDEGTEEALSEAEREEEAEEKKDMEALEDTFEARLVIHQALHLPLMTDKLQYACNPQSSHSPGILQKIPSYRQSEWPPCAYVTTHPHPRVDKVVTQPIPNSQKPVWDHQCLTHIPNLYLDPQCPGLEFQVWHKSESSSSSQEEDTCIGCAHIDLSPLAYGLAQVTGWYNIVDFSGLTQGQIKVTILPSQRISFPATLSPRPSSPVLASGQSILPTTTISEARHTTQAGSTQPNASFMEKTSSVLFRKLRNDLQELDKINSSLKARIQESTGTHLSSTHQFIAQLPSSLPTTVSSVHYSSSGPTPEHSMGSMKEPGVDRATLVMTSESCTSHSVSETASSHREDLAHTQRSGSEDTQQTYSSHSSVSNSLRRSPTPDPLGNPAESLHPEPPPSSAHHTPPSATSSSLSSATTDSRSPDRSHSLTDVSTCNTHDDTPIGSSVLQHPVVEAPNAIGGGHMTPSEKLEHTSTANGEPQSESEGSVVEDLEHDGSQGNSEPALAGPPLAPVNNLSEGGEVQATQGHQDEVPGHPPLLPVRSQQADLQGTTITKETGLQYSTKSDTPPTEVPSLEPAVLSLPTHSIPAPVTSPFVSQAVTTSAESPKQLSSSTQVPEVPLPNFFMPPLELEQTMRSLRASALTRPPPKKLFEGHSPPHQHTIHSTSQDFTRVRTLQDVSRYLSSRRSSRDSHPPRHQELSFKDAERLARVFASKPLQKDS